MALRNADLTSPGNNATAITPSDTVDLTQISRGIYVGVSGDVKVDMMDGGTVTFVGMAAGVIHAIRVTRVYSTGTDAATAASLISIT